jgi:hypothetical protein
MNQIKNSVQLIGHLGNDVRLTTFDSGAKKAEVSLATTQAYKNAKGELIKDTQWHNIIAWGKTADRMVSSLKKDLISSFKELFSTVPTMIKMALRGNEQRLLQIHLWW